jgi:3-hydroxybutyryl-CoA dehydratase
MTLRDFSFDDITVGQTASFSRTITEADVASFVALSGDKNPLHTDPVYAARTEFERPVVHGMLLGALCSALVGVHLPGKRALYLGQTLNFKKPVYPGDTLMVEGTVTQKSTATHLVHIAIEMHRGSEKVFDGVASVQIRPL